MYLKGKKSRITEWKSYEQLWKYIVSEMYVFGWQNTFIVEV